MPSGGESNLRMPSQPPQQPSTPSPGAKTTPRTAPAVSNRTTLALFVLLLVCLFPGIFHLLWSVPLSLLFGPSTPHPAATSHHTCPSAGCSIMWTQKHFTLPSRSRGSYLITDIVTKEVPEIRSYKVGLLNLFVQHTSCALSLNENWDEDVRADMSDTLDRIVPEAGPKGEALYRHDAEGMSLS